MSALKKVSPLADTSRYSAEEFALDQHRRRALAASINPVVSQEFARAINADRISIFGRVPERPVVITQHDRPTVLGFADSESLEPPSEYSD